MKARVSQYSIAEFALTKSPSVQLEPPTKRRGRDMILNVQPWQGYYSVDDNDLAYQVPRWSLCRQSDALLSLVASFSNF